MNPVEDKIFMFTGRLSITRSKAQDLVESVGGIAGASLSKSTDYLVVGEDPGSKLVRAGIMGIPQLTEEQFFKMIEEAKLSLIPKPEPEGIEVKFTLGQLEGTEEITTEQWIKIAELGVTVITEDQFVRLLNALGPSYRNPEKLEKIKAEYPDIIKQGPSVCKWCGSDIPYSTHEDHHVCFNCCLRSDARMGENFGSCQHILESTGITGTDKYGYGRYSSTGPGEYLYCRLCENFVFYTFAELDRYENHLNSVRYCSSAEFEVERVERIKNLPKVTPISEAYTTYELEKEYEKFAEKAKAGRLRRSFGIPKSEPEDTPDDTYQIPP